MAAKKKRTATKKTKRTPAKKAASAKSGSLRSSRIYTVLMIALFFVMTVITLFRLGAVGKIFYGIISLLIGSFAIPLLLAGLFACLYYIWTVGKQTVSSRLWLGLAFLLPGWCLCAALPSLNASDAWGLTAILNKEAMDIVLGSAQTTCGYIGAVLGAVLTTAVSKAGAWLFAICFLLLAIVFIGWESLRLWMIQAREASSQKIKEARAVSKERREERKQIKAQEKEIRQQQMELEEAVPFNMDVLNPAKPAPKKKEHKITSGIVSIFKSDEIMNGLYDSDEPVQKPAAKAKKIKEEPDAAAPAVQKASVRQDFAAVQKEPVQPNAEPVEESPAKQAEKAIAKPAAQPIKSDPKKEEAAFSRQEYLPMPAPAFENYQLPKISLLNEPGANKGAAANTAQAREDGARLIEILNEFNVPAKLTEVHIGPSVTKFEIAPGTGVRVNTITNLQNDIKMALAATDIRIEAPIPGKSAVGIEVPNVEKSEVSMRSLMGAIPQKLSRLPLVFSLGKDLLGDNVYGRLDTMPHLLIAGATGSGKSVCVNSIICSLLMRTRPDEVKLVLVDPKKVEFAPYNGVPHLLAPVITDSELANKALKVVVEMMDRRYDLFEETSVRNITAYNAFVDQNPDSHYKRLPRIVVIIDELADLMLAASKEVEQSIQRITQLARAAGIHLIVATQRPSVNVITGVIKSNIPSRIAFAVSSAVDSRTILDQAGAEKLLGYGDMLFLDNGDTAPRRIQGVYIKDEEVNRIAQYVRDQAQPVYDDAFITLKEIQSQGGAVSPEAADPLYNDVKSFVISTRKASTSLIQRRFSIGYARAARLMDVLEMNGIIGPANGSKPREILVSFNGTEDDIVE